MSAGGVLGELPAGDGESLPGSGLRRFRRWGLVAASFLGPFLLYFFTLAPTVTLEDSGEFITAAFHLGVPHPPGYPLWCMLAHLFTAIPWGNVAERVHLFSAVCGAGACVGVFLIGRRLTGNAWGSLAAAWGLGASRYLWSQSVIAEVYSLNALFVAFCLYAIIEWQQTRRDGWLNLLGLLVGLGASNHFLILLFAPLFAVWILVVDVQVLRRPVVLATSLLWMAIGLTPYLYLPVRASSDPVLNVGDPDTWERFQQHVLRTVYSTGDETIRHGGTFRDALQHFGMALVRHQEAFSIVGVALGLLGLILLARREPVISAALVGIILFNDLVTNVLLQERFNLSWSFVHRVYYIPADVCLAIGIAVAVSWLANALGKAGGVVLLLPVALAAWNGPFCDRSEDRIADQVARDFLRSLPPDACVMCLDDFIYPILYLTTVEGYRSDVHLDQRQFGYRPGTRCSAVYSMVPISPSVREWIKSLSDFTGIPEGLAYRLQRGTSGRPVLSRFPVLDPPPAIPAPSAEPDDIFDHFARGLVANYYTRLGARRLVEGRKADAEAAFDAAEQLAASADAAFLLATTYRERKFRTDRVRPLLEESLRLFDRYYDPSGQRFFPITRADILAELKLASGPG